MCCLLAVFFAVVLLVHVENAPGRITDGEGLVVDLECCTVTVQGTRERMQAAPFSGIQMDIYLRGGLLKQ